MSKRVVSVLAVGAVAVAAALVAGRYLIQSAAYSIPEITRAQLGGKWESETTRSLGGSTGGHTALYRRGASGRRQIAPVVFKETYVGDDCVIYGTPEGCWTSCGDRTPLMVATHCDTWEIVGSRFRTLDGTGVEEPVRDLKLRASR